MNNIIAIASGKGGVGKTWFSITLAHALAKRGKKILLFDGDLGLANVDVQLGLMPKQDLGSVIGDEVTLARAVQRYEEGRFDVLAGRSGVSALASLPAARLQAVLDDLKTLSSQYDYVLLDLGAGVDRLVRQLAQSAGSIFVLSNEEPTALLDSYSFIKMTYRAGEFENFRIVINSASSMAEGDRTYQALNKSCQSFLKFSPPLAGIIRNDPRVRETIRNQTSLLTRFPTSDAATDVDLIAAQLIKNG